MIIDGLDAFTEYGVFVEKGDYKGVIQMPAFKKLDTTEWGEYDGEEVDLMSPVLDTRQFQLPLCITNVRYAEDLFNDLAEGAYHTFEFVELGKTYRLRMVQNGSFSLLVHKGKLTITLADDFPSVPTLPSGLPYGLGQSEVRQSGYELDGTDFSQFGAYLAKGTDESIRKAANVRDNLKIDVKAVAGLRYDGAVVHFKTKDVTLKLLINAASMAEFWARYNALYSVLMQAEERVFYFAVLGGEYDCYYKSSNVSKFVLLGGGRVWCEFSVVLTLTSYRPESAYMLLATEDYDWVITEDATNPARLKVRPKAGICLLVTEAGQYLITESDSDMIYINN